MEINELKEVGYGNERQRTYQGESGMRVKVIVGGRRKGKSESGYVIWELGGCLLEVGEIKGTKSVQMNWGSSKGKDDQ